MKLLQLITYIRTIIFLGYKFKVIVCLNMQMRHFIWLKNIICICRTENNKSEHWMKPGSKFWWYIRVKGLNWWFNYMDCDISDILDIKHGQKGKTVSTITMKPSQLSTHMIETSIFWMTGFLILYVWICKRGFYQIKMQKTAMKKQIFSTCLGIK